MLEREKRMEDKFTPALELAKGSWDGETQANAVANNFRE